MLESTEENQDYRTKKLKEFFKMVDRIYNTNKRLYSNKFFEKALELYQEQKDEAKDMKVAYQEAKQKFEKLAKRMKKEIERMRIESNEARIREEALQEAIRELQQNSQMVVVNEPGCALF